MQTTSGVVSRVRTAGALTAALTLGSLITAATAGAHVHVDADDAVRGQTAVVTFQVPNESETGSPTTQVTIGLPDVGSASTDVMSGWTAALERSGAGDGYRSVTFTAAPDAGIKAQQFELFSLSLALPDTDSVSFPVTQTYADGTTVRWDQPPLPGGGEPERPAPVLTLAAAAAAPAAVQSEPDNTARALAGAALLVAALGVGVAVARRRA